MKKLGMALAAIVIATPCLAQVTQIPTLQVCNIGKAFGSAQVYLSRRVDVSKTGTIDITANDVGCDPQSSSPYPHGTITMRFSLTDTSISDLQVTLIEQMSSIGKHTPTTYLNGRCTANSGTVPCHFWLMLVDNHTSPIDTPLDVLSVLVVDRMGNRLAYGTGPIRSGEITVQTF
ncbi:MAG TPA: hypothetical protein VGQ76_24120 [Thermoanaerobaculia bacterium]|nr:hypothetical protein [Thermoanaerobaculia bacterium]